MLVVGALAGAVVIEEVAQAAPASGPKRPGANAAKPSGKPAAKPDPKRDSGVDAKADPKIETADRLFAEGKALLGSDLLQACGKFKESMGYNPAAIGTLMNVALCDEKLGRVASAVAKFVEARDRATEQGLAEHVRVAEQHIAVLAPEIPHLTIKLTERIADTKILIDDRVIAIDALDNVAIDPGERIVVVSAPARLPYRATLVVGRAEHQDVVIPVLAHSVVVTSSVRRIGQISTIVGVAAIGAGLGIGLYARNLYRDQFGHDRPGDGRCDDLNRCEAAGRSRTQRARTLGNVGTAVGIVGVAVAGVGAYLWYRSPRSSSRPPEDELTIAPEITPDGLGVAASGRF
jgi:hypothetical protein